MRRSFAEPRSGAVRADRRVRVDRASIGGLAHQFRRPLDASLRLFAAVLVVVTSAGVAAGQAPAARIADRAAGLERADGFIPFYWDAARVRVLVEIPAFGQDVLYYVSAATGAGSVEMRAAGRPEASLRFLGARLARSQQLRDSR